MPFESTLHVALYQINTRMHRVEMIERKKISSHCVVRMIYMGNRVGRLRKHVILIYLLDVFLLSNNLSVDITAEPSHSFRFKNVYK